MGRLAGTTGLARASVDTHRTARGGVSSRGGTPPRGGGKEPALARELRGAAVVTSVHLA